MPGPKVKAINVVADPTGKSPAHEEAHTEALLASIGEGVLTTDARGYITRVNQAALDILGFPEAELIGNWLPGVLSACYEDNSLLDNLDRPVTRAIVSGTAITDTLYYRKKNGRTVPVRITASPILMNGKPVGAIEVFRDISEELEQDKFKTEFISIASHQLRTPLSAINMYSHMLHQGLAGELTATQKSFLGVILSASARMNQLINTLLNITRIEAGSITVDPQPTDLAKIICELEEEFKPDIEDKGLRFVCKIPSSLKMVNTDGLLYREICANLLSNAIKYTPAEGQITVRLGKKGTGVVLCVSDTGYGIPKSAQPKIFSKFYRASNIVSQDVSGTGLGLYLIKILAEKLNGELWFTSTLNKGSSFYFSLPERGSVRHSGQFRLEI